MYKLNTDSSFRILSEQVLVGFQWSSPKPLVRRVAVDVAPVEQLDPQAAVPLSDQQMEWSVPQPVFGPGVSKAQTVLVPAAVKAHRTVPAPLKDRPAPTWSGPEEDRS